MGREVIRARVGQVWATSQTPATVWDRLATEEPLEIRIGPAIGDDIGAAGGPDRSRRLAILMRTPGHDRQLALGFLIGERILDRTGAGLVGIIEEPSKRGGPDRVRVEVDGSVRIDPRLLDRPFVAPSSCGFCGRSHLESLGLAGIGTLRGRGPMLEAEVVHALPDRLRAHQTLFEATGGLHAAALMTADGRVVLVREDVGRHNAVDKLVGASCLGTPEAPGLDVEARSGLVLVVSGRAGFEIVHKAIVAGISIVVAVGAPSSLAVEAAEAFGLTLLGFVSPRRFNVYSEPERIRLPEPATL